MSTITIEPVTPDRFADAEHALSGGGDGRSCQCQWWMITNAQWQGTSQEERQGMLRAEVDAGPPPALVAYVDGEAAGWVRVGPRTAQQRIARTRAFADSPHPFDDESVWAVSCFVIRREHRGAGLTAELLDAALAYAADNGARVVEAYPVDPTAAKKRANEMYTGILSTFLAAGFTEVARPKPHLAIVEKVIA